MLINYSWIIRRRRILFSAIVDFLLIIFFYNLVHINNFQFFPNKFDLQNATPLTPIGGNLQ